MKIVGPILATACALLLSACASTPVGHAVTTIQLDDQLKALAKKEPSAEISKRLADLGAQASAQGDASTDIPASVSFYRIAATAAWGAGPPHNTKLLPISDKGGAACARLPAGDAGQARDCAVFKLAPTLAALDSRYLSLQTLVEHRQDISTDQLPSIVQSTLDLFDDIGNVLEKRRASGELSETFIDFLRTRINAYFCAGQWLEGQVDKSGATPQQNQVIKTAALGAERGLGEAAINVSCPLD